jgi:putative hydrolase of the HAD superfamily
VAGGLDAVFLDVGGVMYDDGVYRDTLLLALRELGADVSDEAFAREYEACRRAQSGSFRGRLAARFLGPGADVAEVERRASRHWHYPSASLEPDVRRCLEALARRYRLGVIANQLSSVREAMKRDGIERFFEVWAISEDLGVQKPDPRFFSHALELAGVEASRSVMVGDRLDYDVRPARAIGMRAVWVLRGEAPDEPTPEQLAEADAAVRSLDELPAALERLERL